MSLWIVSVVLLSIGVVHAGWENFLCPTEGNSTVYFPCAADCKHQHGADYGYCGPQRGNYNCYCGPANGKVYPESLMCEQKTKAYVEICDVDCQCSHGAKGGSCNYETKACQCYGRDLKNSLCPYQTVEEFALFIAERAGTGGMVGKYVKPFIGDYENSNPSSVTRRNAFSRYEGFL